MLKKISLIFLILVVLIFLGALFLFGHFKNSNINVAVQQSKEIFKSEEKKVAPDLNAKKLFVTGWLPYWKKDEGVSSLAGKINLFDEINLFAFSVDGQGNLVDTAKADNAPWPALRADAKKENVEIVPTILWGDAMAMHKTFSDSGLLSHHVDAISSMLEKENFAGVDIDYEGKDVADRDNFSAFLEVLHGKLSPLGKTVSCTVEARTQDSVPDGFSGTRAMSWANDFSALNNSCDSVRIMAYDEVFQVHRANVFEDSNKIPQAPNADNAWAEQVGKYALKYIAPEKLTLGIPTYGWEFKLTKFDHGYRYTRVKSISFPQALQEAKLAGVEPVRDAGGELSFIYKAEDGQHIVTFSDAEAVRQKMVIAQNLGIRGVSLFKIDGLSDPQLFPTLANILAK